MYVRSSTKICIAAVDVQRRLDGMQAACETTPCIAYPNYEDMDRALNTECSGAETRAISNHFGRG